MCTARRLGALGRVTLHSDVHEGHVLRCDLEHSLLRCDLEHSLHAYCVKAACLLLLLLLLLLLPLLLLLLLL